MTLQQLERERFIAELAKKEISLGGRQTTNKQRKKITERVLFTY